MMSGQINAEIGHWYRPFGSMQLFEVVAIDEDDQSIEIQYFDGEIESLDFQSWYYLAPQESAPPEDWTGPYELESQDPSFNEYSRQEALRSIEGHYL